MIRALGRVRRADRTKLIVRVPGWPGHRPGQFAMLTPDPRGLHLDPLLPRPMAVYRQLDPEERDPIGGEGDSATTLEFRFKVVGRGTRLLSELRPGSPLGVVGPLGNGFPAPEGRPILVGGGTGIASLYEFARDLGAGRELRVLLGGRSETAILGLREFRDLELGDALELATDDGSAGHRGLVTDLLEPKPGDEIFACGPTPMMRRAAELAAGARVRCFVSLENTMACGFGVCLGCGVPLRGSGSGGTGFAYVCTRGPVFEAAELDWEGLP